MEATSGVSGLGKRILEQKVVARENLFCPECGEELREGITEFSLASWVCPNDGHVEYHRVEEGPYTNRVFPSVLRWIGYTLPFASKMPWASIAQSALLLSPLAPIALLIVEKLRPYFRRPRISLSGTYKETIFPHGNREMREDEVVVKQKGANLTYEITRKLPETQNWKIWRGTGTMVRQEDQEWPRLILPYRGVRHLSRGTIFLTYEGTTHMPGYYKKELPQLGLRTYQLCWDKL